MALIEKILEEVFCGGKWVKRNKSRFKMNIRFVKPIISWLKPSKIPPKPIITQLKPIKYYMKAENDISMFFYRKEKITRL